MRQSSEKPLVVRLCTNPGIKVLASLLILGALVNPTVANDNNDEDWVRDSLSGDHQDQQFVAGGACGSDHANVADDIFCRG